MKKNEETDQTPFISQVPDHLKTPGMIVTVFDSRGNKLCEYYALPGLALSKYVQGPKTKVELRSYHDRQIADVYSAQTNKIIQQHVGKYEEK